MAAVLLLSQANHLEIYKVLIIVLLNNMLLMSLLMNGIDTLDM